MILLKFPKYAFLNLSLLLLPSFLLYHFTNECKDIQCLIQCWHWKLMAKKNDKKIYCVAENFFLCFAILKMKRKTEVLKTLINRKKTHFFHGSMIRCLASCLWLMLSFWLFTQKVFYPLILFYCWVEHFWLKRRAEFSLLNWADFDFNRNLLNWTSNDERKLWGAFELQTYIN